MSTLPLTSFRALTQPPKTCCCGSTPSLATIIPKDLGKSPCVSESEGKPSDNPQPKGMLLYTRDGHMSVQLMYPKSPTNQSNQHVLDGYEASFGSYDVDEARHTLTHHVQRSNIRDLLVGKELPRVYQFTADGKLIIRSARFDEHWSVTWEHY